MDGKFKEVRLPPHLEAKLKELLSAAMTDGPDMQDLGSPDVPKEFNDAAKNIHNLAEYICNAHPHDGASDREKLPKGVELLMRLVERASFPGSVRGESLAIAQEYDREALQEFVNVAAVLSQVLVQTLRYLEHALDGELPAFTIVEGMVTPLLAADVTEDGECDCVNCKARREGKKPPIKIEDILANVTVLAVENDGADEFVGESGPIRDIAKALGGGKKRRKPPVS